MGLARRWAVGALAVAGSAAAAGLASGSGPQASFKPSAERGFKVAERLCISCHVIASQAPGATVAADVPSFLVIARKPGQTAEVIAGRIVLPHPPMPQVQLTREEIADVATYIMSLR